MSVTPGSVFVCEPGEVHETVRAHFPGDYTAIFVDPACVSSVARDLGGADEPHFAPEGIARSDLWLTLHELRDAVQQRESEAFSQRFASWLTTLLEETQPGVRPSRCSNRIVARAGEQLRDEFLSDPTQQVCVRDIAEQQAVPYHSFIRAFSRHYSMAPYEMVSALRARYAFEQLRSGPHGDCTTLTALAVKCGYSDSAHFTRCFHKFWGICPSQLARDLNPAWLARSSGKSRRR